MGPASIVVDSCDAPLTRIAKNVRDRGPRSVPLIALLARFIISQSTSSPRPDSETEPHPIPPIGNATRRRWSPSKCRTTGPSSAAACKVTASTATSDHLLSMQALPFPHARLNSWSRVERHDGLGSPDHSSNRACGFPACDFLCTPFPFTAVSLSLRSFTFETNNSFFYCIL